MRNGGAVGWRRRLGAMRPPSAMPSVPPQREPRKAPAKARRRPSASRCQRSPPEMTVQPNGSPPKSPAASFAALPRSPASTGENSQALAVAEKSPFSPHVLLLSKVVGAAPMKTSDVSPARRGRESDGTLDDCAPQLPPPKLPMPPSAPPLVLETAPTIRTSVMVLHHRKGAASLSTLTQPATFMRPLGGPRSGGATPASAAAADISLRDRKRTILRGLPVALRRRGAVDSHLRAADAASCLKYLTKYAR